jgi:hypothetical protein
MSDGSVSARTVEGHAKRPSFVNIGRGGFESGRDKSLAGIEADILAEFYARLDDSNDIAPAVVEHLRTMLAQDKLPKADEIAALYLAESGDRIA